MSTPSPTLPTPRLWHPFTVRGQGYLFSERHGTALEAGGDALDAVRAYNADPDSAAGSLDAARAEILAELREVELGLPPAGEDGGPGELALRGLALVGSPELGYPTAELARTAAEFLLAAHRPSAEPLRLQVVGGGLPLDVAAVRDAVAAARAAAHDHRAEIECSVEVNDLDGLGEEELRELLRLDVIPLLRFHAGSPALERPGARGLLEQVAARFGGRALPVVLLGSACDGAVATLERLRVWGAPGLVLRSAPGAAAPAGGETGWRELEAYLDGRSELYVDQTLKGDTPFFVANWLEFTRALRGGAVHRSADPAARSSLAVDAAGRLFPAPALAGSGWALGTLRDGVDEAGRRAWIAAAEAARVECGVCPPTCGCAAAQGGGSRAFCRLSRRMLEHAVHIHARIGAVRPDLLPRPPVEEKPRVLLGGAFEVVLLNP